MLVRTISGAAIVVIMMAVIWAGGLVSMAGLVCISCIAYTELLSATGVRKPGKTCVFEIVGMAVIAFYYTLVYLQVPMAYLMLSVVLYMTLLMMIFVFTFPKFNAKEVMYSYFSFVYGPVMISFALMTRLLTTPEDTTFFTLGFFAVWLIFISAWGSDTCAYFVGVLFGKHRITPRLSPKKSVEGCIGGVVGAGLFGLLYGFVLYKTGHIIEDMLWGFPLLGVCGSVIGQVGDLAASAIKRDFQIKDYGKCIPGHGGIMDRFDSIIFTAPLIYLLTITVFG
ncbi:MAG: phosphatidate cytidylyltransferase [Lachnospiraceae bacterium]|nr:phosphatidate cytidylyltransferase [Lachnospiraceae bacterium]